MCRASGCDRTKIEAKGLCASHYQRLRTGRPVDGPLKVRKPGAVCAHPDCDRRVHARGWCNSHYQCYVVRQQVSVEEYDALHEKQAGLCAICQTPGQRRGNDVALLVVDHDHTNMRVRGLLCHSCNRALGLLGDSRERVLAAADYLAVA